MDVLAVLGAAAAGLSFLEAACKTLKKFHGICRGANLSTELNEELEIGVQRIKQLDEKLKSHLQNNSLAGNGPADERTEILQTVEQCIAKANELLKVLEHIRGAGRNLGKLRALYRAWKESSRIENLEDSLQKLEKRLHEIMDRDTWRRVVMMSLEQDQRFSKLETGIQDEIKNIINHDKSTAANLEKILQLVDSLNSEVQKGFRELATRFDEAETNSRMRFEADKAEREQEASAQLGLREHISAWRNH